MNKTQIINHLTTWPIKIIYHIPEFISFSSVHKSHHGGIQSFKKIRKQDSFIVGYPLLNKCGAHFFAHFFAIIAKLTLSNLIRMVKGSLGRGGAPITFIGECPREAFATFISQSIVSSIAIRNSHRKSQNSVDLMDQSHSLYSKRQITTKS